MTADTNTTAKVNTHLSGMAAADTDCRQTDSAFVVNFPYYTMFVPSLSWQMNVFVP